MDEKKHRYSKADFEKAMALLDVLNKSKDWPAYAPLYMDAKAQLDEMVAPPEEEVVEVSKVEDKASKVEDEKPNDRPRERPILPGQPDPRFPSGSLAPPRGVEPSTGRITPPINPAPGQAEEGIRRPEPNRDPGLKPEPGPAPEVPRRV